MKTVFILMMGSIAVSGITFFMLLVTRSELAQLRREVASMRAKLSQLGRTEAARSSTAPGVAPAAAPGPAAKAKTSAPPSRPASAREAKTPRPRPERQPLRLSADLEKIIGGQWLTWLGIIAIFLGSAFFLAMDLGDSSLAGLPQVLIAAAVALVFLAIGRSIVRGVNRFLGLGLLGGGIALFYLVAYGLFGFHQLVGAEIVFPALLLVAFLGALVALAQNSLTIAGLTLTGALLTPMVLTADQGAAFALLPYLIAVDLGSVLVGRRRGWAGLPLGSFVGTALLVASWWGTHYGPDLRILVLACTTVIWMLYGLVTWIGRVRPGYWGLARTALVAANAAWYSSVVFKSLGPDLVSARGPALFVIAAIYVIASVVAGRNRRDDPALVANFYTGAALAILAVPVQFDDFTVSLAWAMVGMLLLVMGWRLGDPHHRLAAMAGLLFAACRVVLTDIPGLSQPPSGFQPVFNLPFLANTAVVAALLGAAWIQRRTGESTAKWELGCNRFTEPAAAFTAWWVLTAEASRLVAMPSGAPLSLITVPLIWAAYAAVVQGLGLRSGQSWLRKFALASLVGAGCGAFVIQTRVALTATTDWIPFLNAGFVAGSAALVVLVWMSRTCSTAGPRSAAWERQLGTPLLVSALGFGLLVATLELLAWFHARNGESIFTNGAALLSISIFWTLYGGALIWGGFGFDARAVRLAGMALLGMVVVKIFAVDMRALTAGYRIISFVGVGALLLVVSLLYQRERRTEGGESVTVDKDPDGAA